LGSAYPLLFLLTKYFALVIILLFMYIGSFSIIINYYFECNNPKNCVKFFGLIIYNFEQEKNQLSQISVGMVTVLLIATVVYLKRFIFSQI